RAVLTTATRRRRLRRHSHDAPESEVADRGVHGLRHAGRRPVPPAVVRRAQVRAALHHLARDANVGQAGVVALLSRAAPGVADGTAGLLDLAVVLVPVGGPLPDVAGHLVEPVAVGWKGAERRRPFVAVVQQVLPWEFALPGVAHV